MNCKLKLHSKGFGAEPVLKFLQTLVLDFPHIYLQFFRKLQWAGRNIFADKCMENFRKLFLCMQLHVTPSDFFSRVLRSVKLKFTIHVFFFNRQLFSGNYLTLDYQADTAISHAVAYSSRWLPKPLQGLLYIKSKTQTHFILSFLAQIFLLKLIFLSFYFF